MYLGKQESLYLFFKDSADADAIKRLEEPSANDLLCISKSSSIDILYERPPEN